MALVSWSRCTTIVATHGCSSFGIIAAGDDCRTKIFGGKEDAKLCASVAVASRKLLLRANRSRLAFQQVLQKSLQYCWTYLFSEGRVVGGFLLVEAHVLQNGQLQAQANNVAEQTLCKLDIYAHS